MPIDIPAPAAVKGLPMAARIDLRDSYGKPDSDLGQSVAKLTTDLGLDAVLHLDWNAAWDKLKAPFKDEPQKFVPRLGDAATDLVTSVHHAIDEDEAWGDKLLSEISRAGKSQLDLFLVIDGDVAAPQPVWHPIDASITLRLPTRPAAAHTYYTPGSLVGPMRSIFSEGDTGSAEAVEKRIPITAGPQPPKTVAASSQPQQQPRIPSEPAKPKGPDRMPTLVSIPQPSALSESSVPYFATIIDTPGSVEVLGTHEPTLDLLADYMEKWAVPNPNVTTRAPYVRIERCKSPFGPGIISVFVERVQKWGPQPTSALPLQFLIGPLGYAVMKTDGRTWVLKRDHPLTL